MSFPLHIFTLALDAMPWLAASFAELNRLTDIPWTWTIVEGAAMNVKDTRWMQAQPARLSTDGTTEFIDAIAHHPRVRISRFEKWEGKVEMCNAALAGLSAGVLMQIDADELWTADQLREIVHLFEDDPALMHARFHCRYFLGPNIITTDNGNPNEWLRAWRFTPGMKFDTHEPPVLSGNKGKGLSRLETRGMGLVFDHYSWGLPKHVAMKEKLYGKRHAGALEGWKKLQANKEWPLADAGKFMPLAFRGAPCDKIF